ncbi:ATP synthase F1 subcomplex delta subunit [Saccharicrinis carchari]|uniref:ATP synthase subunit delta n=1 Tax=Saccharicrinis carchari TaxID=1168039 RepID=A0A521CMQ3_SACCC|nr:ATP synthase F1 subunit delta [Saccharicrinis carchari]SMO60729.1 ATP synthase F1 subcomplex delta subunit [Saccharicrinis carchari]
MNASLISVRYAKALFLLSKEKGAVEQVYGDMTVLLDYCNNVPEFDELLNSPVIKPGKKKKALKGVFEKRVNQLTLNFLTIMVNNKREPLLASIARNVIDFYKEEKNIKSVALYTAVPLEEDHLSRISEMLQQELNAKIQLTVRVRDKLIGGFVLMVDGKMIDATIANKLKELKKKLLS